MTTHMLTDRIGRHELLSPLLNLQEVERVIIITGNYKLFWPRAVETDTFHVSCNKSKGLTSCRRQFPEGYDFGKISAQPHTTLCIQFLDRENNDKNNRLPLGKQICFTIVWSCAEILQCFSIEILKNILKRSCPFEFLFKQFYSVLLSSCSLLRFLLLLGHSFDLSP